MVCACVDLADVNAARQALRAPGDLVVSLRLPLILQLGDALSEQIKDLDSNPAGSGQRLGQGRSGIEGIGIIGAQAVSGRRGEMRQGQGGRAW